MGALLRSPAALVILGLWAAATLWPSTPRTCRRLVLLNPHLPSLAYYASFFVFGYVLHARRETNRVHVDFLLDHGGVTHSSFR